MCPALRQFIILHSFMKEDGQRLGQRFCNRYIPIPYPELFYASDGKALKLINEWLKQYDYEDVLPGVIK